MASVQSLQSMQQQVLDVKDSDSEYIELDFLEQYAQGRYPEKITAKLVNQFLSLNRRSFDQLDIVPRSHFDGDSVRLSLTTASKIGAVPLWSPVTYKPEFSLIVKPRFGWNGIGPLLSKTGWRTLPSILQMPQLKISERRVPPWVLSSVVLRRLEGLIQQLDRRFEMTDRFHRIPKGKVDWGDYARNRIPSGQFLNIHCHYPELQDNRDLKSMVHFALQKQKESLETQRNFGTHVMQLIDYCEGLIQRVSDVTPQRPSKLMIEKMPRQTGLKMQAMDQGLKAIEWTVEEKGLAGLGDLHGLPWEMSMAELFESYVESVMERLTRRVGGHLRSARNKETTIPINWKPPIIGSQRSLKPDVLVDREDTLHIIDAKYKDHWEDLNLQGWNQLQEEIRNRHRNDLLQVLAYASVAEQKEIQCTLMYPCRRQTWESLIERGRHIHSADITQSERRIRVQLTAIPFRIDSGELGYLEPVLRS